MHLGRSWLLDRWAVGPFFYYYSGHRGLPNEQRPLSSGLVVRDLRSDILTPVTPSLTPVCQKIASTSSLLFSPISPSLWYCAPRIQGASKCIRYSKANQTRLSVSYSFPRLRTMQLSALQQNLQNFIVLPFFSVISILSDPQRRGWAQAWKIKRSLIRP